MRNDKNSENAHAPEAGKTQRGIDRTNWYQYSHIGCRKRGRIVGTVMRFFGYKVNRIPSQVPSTQQVERITQGGKSIGRT